MCGDNFKLQLCGGEWTTGCVIDTVFNVGLVILVIMEPPDQMREGSGIFPISASDRLHMVHMLFLEVIDYERV